MTYRDATVAVLIPAYNEERQIAGVLASIPAFVDHIVVVDDASTDRTAEAVERAASRDPRIRGIRHKQNQGVGGALATAYKWALAHGVDCAVTIDGDGQMDTAEMVNLVAPIVDGIADYTKGNRLTVPEKWGHIPRVRLLGNAVLSLLTKIASGYWSVADSQSGYTAISRYGMESIDWDKSYKRYGRPNDVLVRANVANCRVADVPIRPIYGVGERSTMNIMKAVFTISWMLFRRFWWRLFHKYVLTDFHPLVFFYALASVTFLLDIFLFVRLITHKIQDGFFPPITMLAVAFMTITALNSTFFAFWMDMQVNDPLNVRLPDYYKVRSAVTTGRDAPKESAPERRISTELPAAAPERAVQEVSYRAPEETSASTDG